MNKLIILLALVFLVSGCYSIDVDSRSDLNVDTCEWSSYTTWYVWERSWKNPLGNIVGSHYDVDGPVTTTGKNKKAGEIKARAQAEEWLKKYKECIKEEAP